MVEAMAAKHGFSTHVPVRDLKPEDIEKLLHSTGEHISVRYVNQAGRTSYYDTTYEGVIPNLSRRFRETESDYVRSEIERYMTASPCPDCKGARLKPESLAVTIDDKNIIEVTQMSLFDEQRWFEHLAGPQTPLSARDQQIAYQILKEIRARLDFLVEVGVGYLTLDRRTATLSGGEAQRIRLATQIGSGLMGVLYVCDEPTVGLHAADDARLIRTLERLRDLGNTVIVVEHDEAMMRAADHIIDMGPGAGEQGGTVVVAGTMDEVKAEPRSITGQYLSGAREIPLPGARRARQRPDARHPGRPREQPQEHRRDDSAGQVRLHHRRLRLRQEHAHQRHPLQEGRAAPVRRPRPPRRLRRHHRTAATSTRSSTSTSRPSAARRAPTRPPTPAPSRPSASSSPPSPKRGCAATRPGASPSTSRAAAARPAPAKATSRSRCTSCPTSPFPAKSARAGATTARRLRSSSSGKNIADVLDMTVDQAADFFHAFTKVRGKLETLQAVGLGYIRLGQPATTLSGGEAQRVKLSTELSRRSTGRTLYILDEPTTGLSFEDTYALLRVLHRLVDGGNTVVIIEHHLDVVKNADHIIDLGPLGGDEGGEIVVEGTPEEVAEAKHSFTGQYLRAKLTAAAAVP